MITYFVATCCVGNARSFVRTEWDPLASCAPALAPCTVISDPSHATCAPHLELHTPPRTARRPNLALHSSCCVKQPPLGDSKYRSTCCNRMFYVFQVYITYVSSGCCKSRSGVTYVVMAIHICFNISNVCCKCFIWICICCNG
jgi:hypothetical protein